MANARLFGFLSPDTNVEEARANIAKVQSNLASAETCKDSSKLSAEIKLADVQRRNNIRTGRRPGTWEGITVGAIAGGFLLGGPGGAIFGAIISFGTGIFNWFTFDKALDQTSETEVARMLCNGEKGREELLVSIADAKDKDLEALMTHLASDHVNFNGSGAVIAGMNTSNINPKPDAPSAEKPSEKPSEKSDEEKPNTSAS
jgi:hypothetical protein